MKRTLVCTMFLLGSFAILVHAQGPVQNNGPALPALPLPGAAQANPLALPPPQPALPPGIPPRASAPQLPIKAAPQTPPTEPVAQPGTVRIKDISRIQGEDDNFLQGIGLVTGLNNTGGNAPLTRKVVRNFLDRHDLRADPNLRAQIATDTQEKTSSMAVVMVTCRMPPFASHGTEVDVIVSVMDDATSLQGGKLEATALRGIDNQVHAMAQGMISTGGFSFSGAAASIAKNHPTTGRISNGGRITVPAPSTIGQSGIIRFDLRSPDRRTAQRVAEAINKLHHRTALALNKRVIEVIVPAAKMADMSGFIAEIEDQRVVPDSIARVVINERTGTVIVGANVRISPVAITHANLTVVTKESADVAQPNPLAGGETVVVPKSEIDVIEEERAISVLDRTVTVGDLANALNALGVAPRDLSSIFQALKSADALHAELIKQ